MLYTTLIVTAVLLSLTIIGLVLVQHGRGADTGAAFGGGASGSVFGSRGSASFLSRITGMAAALFFINCLALAWVVKNVPSDDSLIRVIPEGITAPTPGEATVGPGGIMDVESDEAESSDVPVAIPSDADVPAAIPDDADVPIVIPGDADMPATAPDDVPVAPVPDPTADTP